MSKQSTIFIFSALLFFCITGCRSCRSSRGRITQDSALYTSRAFSDCYLDSTFIISEIERDSAFRPYAGDIIDFYQRRGFEAAWFDGDSLGPGARDFLSALRSYEQDFADSAMISGLDESDLEAAPFLPQGRTMLDLRLTGTFFKYAQRVYGGTDADLRDLEWYIPRKKKNYQRLIDSLVASPARYSIYEPVNEYYKKLKKALILYRSIEKNGGMPAVRAGMLPLHTGDSAEAIILIKRSLRLSGDYSDPDSSTAYTRPLALAVACYQRRVGLHPTGIIDSLTLAELNTSVGIRIRQIMLNMERLRWMPDTMPAEYIIVNIPEYRLHIVAHHHDTLSMDVVVGKAATETSIFTGRLSVVEFDPYWNVPQSIIRHEMLPILKRDPGYLARNHMQVLSHGAPIDPNTIDWNKYSGGLPFDIRQLPGPDCALGLVAFFFPNSFDIYLHDTPAKSFFSQSDRAFSHGCIRLSEPDKLAAYVFRHDSTMAPTRIRELMDRHQEQKFPVRPSIPVYIVYFTAWVDEEGRINFRHDIYGHDAKLSKEIFGK